MRRAAASVLAIALLLFSPRIPAADVIIINAVGDIMLAGRWAPVLRQKGLDFPFGGTLAELANGDINLANLESPIAQGGSEFTEKRYRYRADPELALALRKAGFDLVSLANNHSMDFGEEALRETLEHLGTAGIAWIGAGENLAEARKMVIFNVKGKRVAFLGYSLTHPAEFFAGPLRAGTTPGLERIYTKDIARARSVADYVIASFHWGAEGSATIRSYQRNVAHGAIDAGADAVIGHHPHVLQGIERYRNGIIFYSLGNFAFASNSGTARFGALVRLRLDDAVREAEIVPLDVLAARVHFRPRVLSGNKGAAVINKLQELSKPFYTRIRNRGGRYFVKF